MPEIDPLFPAFASLPARADRIGVALSPDQVEILCRHFALVLERNKVVNLTRVTDPEEAVAKLYLASLSVIPGLAMLGVLTEGLFRTLDLGTGAGFPGVPLAVACPHMHVTLVDARRKKTDFLTEAIATLGLPNAVAMHGRGADLARTRSDFTRRFDLVTARAVAGAADTIEEAGDLLFPGGVLAIYKGPGLEDAEIRAGARAAERKGLVYRGLVEPEVENLSPRILVYSSWSARDEKVFDG